MNRLPLSNPFHQLTSDAKNAREFVEHVMDEPVDTRTVLICVSVLCAASHIVRALYDVRQAIERK